MVRPSLTGKSCNVRRERLQGIIKKREICNSFVGFVAEKLNEEIDSTGNDRIDFNV